MDIELQAALVDLYDTAKRMKDLRGQRSSIYLEKRLFDTADRITGLIAELEHEARQSQDDHIGNVPEASPDTPGGTQAPVPDPMPETAPAEPQNADESVGVAERDYRMETIRAWATAAQAKCLDLNTYEPSEAVDILDRIIELAGDR